MCQRVESLPVTLYLGCDVFILADHPCPTCLPPLCKENRDTECWSAEPSEPCNPCAHNLCGDTYIPGAPHQLWSLRFVRCLQPCTTCECIMYRAHDRGKECTFVQGSCGCPIPGCIQGQAGCGWAAWSSGYDSMTDGSWKVHINGSWAMRWVTWQSSQSSPKLTRPVSLYLIK